MNKENKNFHKITLTVFAIAIANNVLTLHPWIHFTLGLIALALGAYILCKAIWLWRKN